MENKGNREKSRLVRRHELQNKLPGRLARLYRQLCACSASTWLRERIQRDFTRFA